jgi:hypothetical protein
MIDKAGILMAKAIMVLAPDVGREGIVEGGDGPPPGDLIATDLEPLSTERTVLTLGRDPTRGE